MPGRNLEEVRFLVGYNFEQPMLNSQAIITYQCWYWPVVVVWAQQEYLLSVSGCSYIPEMATPSQGGQVRVQTTC